MIEALGKQLVMTTLELHRELALEIGKQWASCKDRSQPHRTTIIGQDGDPLDILLHDYLPLLIEKPIPSRKLDSEVLWRVAFDRIALKIKLRRQVSAFLRPIGSGDFQDLPMLEILNLESKGFSNDLDQTLERLYLGQQERALIARQRTLMAHLGPFPPLTLHGVPAVSRDELVLLEALRNSPISRDQLALEVGAWVESLRSGRSSADQDG